MLLINNFMVLQEAADRWGIPIERLKNKLKPSIVGQDRINEWIKSGLIKCYVKPGGKNKVWIISIDFMKMHFGHEKK